MASVVQSIGHGGAGAWGQCAVWVLARWCSSVFQGMVSGGPPSRAAGSRPATRIGAWMASGFHTRVHRGFLYRAMAGWYGLSGLQKGSQVVMDAQHVK